jgi:hypothetical protein
MGTTTTTFVLPPATEVVTERDKVQEFQERVFDCTDDLEEEPPAKV